MMPLQTTRPALTALSFYTGAGGLDLGFEAAGFRTVVAIENDTHARETLRQNRSEWSQPRDGDALTLDPRLVFDPGRHRRDRRRPTVPPFSKSAFWAAGSTKRLDDPRARTLEAMLTFTEALLPRALVIENVRGIAYREKDEAIQLIRQRLGEINARNGTSYSDTVHYLKATNFGVPQLRERAFLVALREGGAFEEPQAICASDGKAVPTAWDAIGAIRPGSKEIDGLALRGKWADLLPSIPAGQNYTWHTDSGGGLPLFGWRTRYWSFLLKLAKDQPAWTIQADPGPATGPFHWDNRLLSIEELARLQTFPPGYSFSGGYRAARRQIGNAVPPALAEAVARRLAATLLGIEYSNRLTRAVERAGPIPAAATPKRVPGCFLPLIGDHAAHPGPGKGPGALGRAAVSAISDGRREHPDGHAPKLSSEDRAAA